ncbi:MAG: PhzF family phenazine biosynthesis protein, partial [Flavobacteriaceae bacterium]|nr:PhzF family phenazine biosynthesis protein [Flavobacteriaceae bacterium]
VLLNVAKENGVPETAFFVKKNNEIHLRWFTPDIEMDLCGHATLATAHVIKKHLQYQGEILNFKTLSGDVKVSISNDKYFLDFPSRIPVDNSLPNNLKEALNLIPNRVLKSRDYVLVYENEAAIRNIQIKRNLFDTLDLGTGGVVVTSQGEKVDFVSRFFTPRATLLEDPVTGSAHCSLIPFWASKLNKERLSAQQLSERGGTLICENLGDRVLIGGEARTFLEGTFKIK